MALFLGAGSITVLFTTLTVVFMVTHGAYSYDERTNSMVHTWIKVSLPHNLLLFNTLVLLVSSGTVEVARRLIARDVALAPVRLIPGISLGRERGLSWLAATTLLGLTFLWGQALAWRELLSRGFYLSSGSGSSFIYLLTATHAVHLTVGICVLVYALASYFFKRPVEARHIVVDVTAWYWHFMLVLWVYIFALMEFAA
jgi:cytochrome c oxidase subunit 3